MSHSDGPQIIRGDGSSPENAIKFEPCHISRRVVAEREFVCSLFGTENIHWTEQMHYTSLDGQSVWVIELDDGTARDVFFETEGTIYNEG